MCEACPEWKRGRPSNDPHPGASGRPEQVVVVQEAFGDVYEVDVEIADIVSALNRGGLRTTASCSGHGTVLGSVRLADGRWLVVAPDHSTADALVHLEPSAAA